MKVRKQKQKTIFGRILLIFIILSLSGIFFLWVRLWHYLEDYQAALPSQIGEKVLLAYQSYDTPTLRSLCSNLPDRLQDDFAYQDYLHQIVDTKDLYYYESGRDDKEGIITYTYITKGQDFATLTVHKTDETSRFDFPIYKAVSLKQRSLVSYDFYQAAGTTIYLDGQPIDDTCLTGQTSVASAFDELQLGPYYDKQYTVPDNLAMGTITATDLNGSNAVLTWDDSHQTCTTHQNLSDEVTAPVNEFALQSAKTYATFATLKNSSREPVLSCLYPDTAFYSAIRSYDNSWGISSTADVFSNEQIISCIQYSEEAFTCEVSFDYTVTQGANQKVYPLHFLLYLVKQEGDLKVLSLETLS